MLEIRKLDVTGRRGRRLLHGISLAVQGGEVCAVIGPNGAGKSTLMKTVTGLLPFEHGDILLDGESLPRMGRAPRARRVAYLPQHTAPVPCAVFDAVMLGRRPHIAWRAGKRDRAVTGAILEELHLSPLRDACITGLSGGELQKVLIARALAQEAPVLVLDEPVNHLDISNQLEILRAIRKITRRRGMATLVVLHDLGHALRFADTALLLHRGGVVYQGPAAELPANALSGVYGIPVALHDINGVRHVVF